VQIPLPAAVRTKNGVNRGNFDNYSTLETVRQSFRMQLFEGTRVAARVMTRMLPDVGRDA